MVFRAYPITNLLAGQIRKLREAWRLVFASVCRQKVTVSRGSLTPIDRITTIGTG